MRDVVCLIGNDEKFENTLVGLKVTKTAQDTGYYAPLGGKVDQGEEPEEAIIREIKEEANIDLSMTELTLFHEAIITLKDDWRILYFLGVLSQEQLEEKRINEPQKVQEIEMYGINNVPMPMHTHNLEAIQKSLQYSR